MEGTQSLQFCSIWDLMYRWKTKNIAKKQNFYKNYILRNIKKRKSLVPEKSRNSSKMKEKNIFWD